MSVLDRGPHTVVVIPKVPVRNVYNGWDLIDGPEIVMRGVFVQASTVQEVKALGEDQAGTLFYRVLGRGPWPGGVKSTIRWNGRLWDQHGEAKVYSGGTFTHHFVCRIKAQSAEVK